MKLITNLLIALLIPGIAFADPVVRNESQTTLYSTDGQVGPHVSVDRYGNQSVTIVPAGEKFQSCYASAITDGSTYALKAAVASNRIYVTDIECTNASTTASLLVFADGGTTVLYGALSNTTVDGIGRYQRSFQTPIRGTVNTAFNVTLGTTATNTRCCIYGYISVN